MRHTTARRRRAHEEHTNHEAWAIPYADLLTLLLAFFVVMYAISSVNAGKYRVVSDSLFAAFHGSPRAATPIQVGDKPVDSGADAQAGVVQQSTVKGPGPSQLAPVPVEVGLSRSRGDVTLPGKLPPQAAAAAAALSQLADQVERAMSDLVQKDIVTVRRNDFWIEVEMRTDILFPSGSARLSDPAVGIIERLGSVLSPFPNPIRVEGHTDNKPIRTAVFSSNWELSAARAGSVVRVLANHGVAPDRLAVIGYGEQRPAKPNTTSEGRNANRRVVVVILSTELMRQTDPAKLTPPTAAAHGAASVPQANSVPAPNALGLPVAQPGEPATPARGGAIASPGDTPQAVPVPTSATAIKPQHNSGTEPAP
ncbi:MAG TPA: flagellar motor protein MotD [Steroidobacteraceae bacterium]|nr:flagellar motor protein MotD [Steroidobacteraceae bacterium]